MGMGEVAIRLGEEPSSYTSYEGTIRVPGFWPITAHNHMILSFHTAIWGFPKKRRTPTCKEDACHAVSGTFSMPAKRQIHQGWVLKYFLSLLVVTNIVPNIILCTLNCILYIYIHTYILIYIYIFIYWMCNDRFGCLTLLASFVWPLMFGDSSNGCGWRYVPVKGQYRNFLKKHTFMYIRFKYIHLS